MNTEHSERPGNGDVEAQRKLNPGGPLGGITGKGFLPGQSGCPGGKRKGRSPTKMLAQISTPDELRKVCESILTAASKGDIAAAKLIFDRLDGSVASILQMAAGPTPRPNETPNEFFTRLCAEAESCTARTFPGWEKPAPHIKLKWNAANDEPIKPMVVNVISSDQPHPGETDNEMYLRMEAQSQSDVRRAFPQWRGLAAFRTNCPDGDCGELPRA